MLKRFWGRVCGAVTEGVGTLGEVVGVGCAAVVAVYSYLFDTAAAAEVTVPDIGVDWGSIGTNAGVSLGEVIIGLIGIAIAIAIVKAGIRLMRSMFS